MLGLLLAEGLLDLKLLAQDGIRVRASASAPSFRRGTSLAECREQALLHLKAEQAARKAAARDYLRRVDAAMGSRTSRGPFLVRPRHPRATVTIRGRLTQCVLQARRIDTS